MGLTLTTEEKEMLEGKHGKATQKAMEIMPVKGIGIGGFDTEIYRSILTEQFGMEPLNIYGTTESGFIMIGSPDRKRDLMPLLNCCHIEFLNDDEKVRKINELEKDVIYELVCTPFRSVIMRYRMGDLFKVLDFRDDGMPIFGFESRKEDLLDIHGYFRFSEALAVKALLR